MNGFLKSLVSVFALALLCVQAAQADSLKVLTLNFNSELVRSDPKNVIRDSRIARISNWVQTEQPDIIFLQEAWNYKKDPSVAVTLGRLLNYDVAYRLGLGIKGFFLDSDAVLTKKSLHMEDEVDLKLPHSAIEFGNGKTWIIELGAVSYAVGVKVTLPSNEVLFAYSTHLVGSTGPNRADQAQAIEQDAKKRASDAGISWDQAHVLIAGDFNDAPQAPAPTALIQDGFVDSFDAVHPGDSSCSSCGDPAQPYFNPYTMGAGLVPGQNVITPSLRYDYLFVKSPSLKPVSSTLVFSTPQQGIWMSDHYGLLTELSTDGQPLPGATNPVRDISKAFDLPPVLTLSTEQFLCAGFPQPEYCTVTLPPVQVGTPSGLVIQNDSDFYVETSLQGNGQVFTSPNGALQSGEANAFTFSAPGRYTLTIHNLVKSPNPYHAGVRAVIQVVP